MINNFKENENVSFKALIKQRGVKKTKTDKDYLQLVLMDQTGTISGNLWDVEASDVEALVEGAVVQVDGSVSSYQGKLQLNFKRLVRTEGAASDFVESAPVDLAPYMAYIHKTVDALQNPDYKRICQTLLKKHEQAFVEYPAAVKVHHAYKGGLAFHTATMLGKAESLSKFYPWLNKDLLLAGTVLHDFGKTEEMPGLFGENYTTAGELLGHIALLLEEIVEICIELQIDFHKEEILLLKHMVASHHGTLEWGSVATPRIPEAMMLHMIDMMDAKMEQYRKVYETLPAGEWTKGKEFFLGNTRVYRPHH